MSLVQQQLGHSNIQTTTIYSAAKKPAIKKAIKDIPKNKPLGVYYVPTDKDFLTAL